MTTLTLKGNDLDAINNIFKILKQKLQPDQEYEIIIKPKTNKITKKEESLLEENKAFYEHNMTTLMYGLDLDPDDDEKGYTIPKNAQVW